MATDLVPVAGCPDCGSLDLREFGLVDEALFLGGGYGGSRVTWVRTCPACGWESGVQESTIRPQRRRIAVRVP
jgi:hypothetical protein